MAAGDAVRALTVYFDFVSPFAYLMSEILPGRAREWQERGCVDALVWRPIDMLALSAFEGGLPYSPKKRAYVGADAVRSAALHGVSIQVPKPFPVRSGPALRLAAVVREQAPAAKLRTALFRAAWRDARDLERAEVLKDALREAGIEDIDARLAQVAAAEAQRCLEANTAEAEAAGVFGVPTLVLEGELFWGTDSLPALEWRLGERGRG